MERKAKRMICLALVVCALTTSVAATIVMPSLPTNTLPVITERGFQPLGDPIDIPGPPPMPYSPSP